MCCVASMCFRAYDSFENWTLRWFFAHTFWSNMLDFFGRKKKFCFLMSTKLYRRILSILCPWTLLQPGRNVSFLRNLLTNFWYLYLCKKIHIYSGLSITDRVRFLWILSFSLINSGSDPRNPGSENRDHKYLILKQFGALITSTIQEEQVYQSCHVRCRIQNVFFWCWL